MKHTFQPTPITAVPDDTLRQPDATSDITQQHSPGPFSIAPQVPLEQKGHASLNIVSKVNASFKDKKTYFHVPIALDCDALLDLLTPRELEIVCLIAFGLPNKQIASRLDISTWTVSAHLRRIFAKLHVDTRAAVVYQCANLIQSLAPPTA